MIIKNKFVWNLVVLPVPWTLLLYYNKIIFCMFFHAFYNSLYLEMSSTFYLFMGRTWLYHLFSMKWVLMNEILPCNQANRWNGGCSLNNLNSVSFFPLKNVEYNAWKTISLQHEKYCFFSAEKLWEGTEGMNVQWMCLPYCRFL